MALPKKEYADVVSFLIKIGAITKEATVELKDVQIEALIEMLVKNRSISPEELETARNILQRLGSGNGGLKTQIEAKTDMMKLITAYMHKRVIACSMKSVKQKVKFQSAEYGNVAHAKVKDD